ncbi:MAG: hypothetical protein WCZ18_10470 [Ottowia sp.]|nr:hypothetical protein [Ottowia sp.]
MTQVIVFILAGHADFPHVMGTDPPFRWRPGGAATTGHPFSFSPFEAIAGTKGSSI